MYKEFVLPYLAKLSERFGLVYYGCCERVDDRLEMIIDAIPNLRSVSVSGWSNLAKTAEILGKNYVYSRKPTPAHISGPNPNWDLLEKDMQRHLRRRPGLQPGDPLPRRLHDQRRPLAAAPLGRHDQVDLPDVTRLAASRRSPDLAETADRRSPGFLKTCRSRKVRGRETGARRETSTSRRCWPEIIGIPREDVPHGWQSNTTDQDQCLLHFVSVVSAMPSVGFRCFEEPAAHGRRAWQENWGRKMTGTNAHVPDEHLTTWILVVPRRRGVLPAVRAVSMVQGRNGGDDLQG